MIRLFAVLACLFPFGVLAQECVFLPIALAQMAAQGFTEARTIPVPEAGAHLLIMRSKTGFLSAFSIIDAGQCVWSVSIPLGQETPVKDKGTPS